MLKLTLKNLLFASCTFAGILLMGTLTAVDCQAQRLSDTEQQVRNAYRSVQSAQAIKLNEFRTIFDWLTESAGKEKWREINWRFDLLKARDEAAKANKPIFIWAMNGDPLGCV